METQTQTRSIQSKNNISHLASLVQNCFSVEFRSLINIGSVGDQQVDKTEIFGMNRKVPRRLTIFGTPVHICATLDQKFGDATTALLRVRIENTQLKTDN